MVDRNHIPIIAAFIEQLASCSEAFSMQAGVGAAETAGFLISYLAEHPRDIEPFLAGGFLELPDRWLEQGRLAYRAMNGEIVLPEDARRARIIKQMERGDHA